MTDQPRHDDAHGSDTAAEGDQAGRSAGSWYCWWRGDPLPAPPAPPHFAAHAVADAPLAARLVALDEARTHALLQSGHRPYLARLDDVPVGHGWSAADAAEIGELGLSFALPPRSRYLWGFETRPDWRGRGIYPQLLRAILDAETVEADRFWIGHEPGNAASARGILKAGFRRVGDLYFLPEGGFGLLADGAPERGQPAADVLGVRLLPLPDTRR